MVMAHLNKARLSKKIHKKLQMKKIGPFEIAPLKAYRSETLKIGEKLISCGKLI